jgi:hypothetical protein
MRRYSDSRIASSSEIIVAKGFAYLDRLRHTIAVRGNSLHDHAGQRKKVAALTQITC